MAYEFYLGIDASDATRRAMAIVEKASRRKPSGARAGNGRPASDDLPRYALRAAELFDAERSADACADRVQAVIADQPYIGHTLIISNREGRDGKAMTDLLVAEGLTPVAAGVTPGRGAGEADTGIVGTGRKGGDEEGFNVSAQTLYTTLRDLYRSGQINVADLDLPTVSSMLDRLHDDESDDDAPDDTSLIDDDPLIRAIALACWYGERRSHDPSESLDDDVPPTGRPKPAVN